MRVRREPLLGLHEPRVLDVPAHAAAYVLPEPVEEPREADRVPRRPHVGMQLCFAVDAPAALAVAAVIDHEEVEVGAPEEVASAVLFLADSDSAYITGVDLFVRQASG